MGLGRHTAVSDTGRKRRHNEDSYVVRPPLFAVADGMGGAQAGEVASRLAVEAIADDDGAGDGEGRVAALVREANRRVYEHAGSDSATSGMGTTMTVALVENGTVAIGHVGDSRAYLVRDGMLEQLTQDHSLVAELIRSGKLSPEEAESHPQRSVITRALGTDPDVDVDTYHGRVAPGRRVPALLRRPHLDGRRHSHPRGDRGARPRPRQRRRGSSSCAPIAAAARTTSPSCSSRSPRTARPRRLRRRRWLRCRSRLPPAQEPDEDTLDELDHVPAVATQVFKVEELEAAVAEAPSKKRRSRMDRVAARVLATVVVLAVVAGIVLLVVWGLLD